MQFIIKQVTLYISFILVCLYFWCVRPTWTQHGQKQRHEKSKTQLQNARKCDEKKVRWSYLMISFGHKKIGQSPKWKCEFSNSFDSHVSSDASNKDPTHLLGSPRLIIKTALKIRENALKYDSQRDDDNPFIFKV